MLFIEDSSSDQLGHSVNNISDYRVFDKQFSGVALLQKVARLIKHVNHELD